MLDFIIFKLDTNVLTFWFLRILFMIIGIIYITYVLLQLRQIGIMNTTLKTRGGIPIAIVGMLHLILVVIVILIVELILFLQ